MRLGIYLALFASLAMVVALVLPVPYGPRPIPGDPAALLSRAPLCLRLRYDAAGNGDFPSEVRLRRAARFRTYFAADGGPELFRLYGYASWRPAGHDSIDIAWHHSPVLRIPIWGDSLVGRGQWAGVQPLSFLFDLRQFRVVARPFPCSEFVLKDH